MSSNTTLQSGTKLSLAQKFGRELEKHINFADQLARNLSNRSLSNSQEAPSSQRAPQNMEASSPQLLTNENNHDQLKTENDYSISELRQSNRQENSRESISRLEASSFQNSPSRSQARRSSYANSKTGSPPKKVSETLNTSQVSQNRKETKKSTSSALNDSRRSVDMSRSSIRTEKGASAEHSLYILPNLEKSLSFKKKLIHDSMQRLKNSSNNPVPRNNASKSPVPQPQAKESKINRGSNSQQKTDAKKLMKPEDKSKQKKNSMQESMMNRRANSIVKLEKRSSYPNITGSPVKSLSNSQIFRQSESGTHIVNVSRLDDQSESHEKDFDIRRFSADTNVLKENTPAKSITMTQQSEVEEASMNKELENTHYTSKNPDMHSESVKRQYRSEEEINFPYYVSSQFKEVKNPKTPVFQSRVDITSGQDATLSVSKDQHSFQSEGKSLDVQEKNPNANESQDRVRVEEEEKTQAYPDFLKAQNIQKTKRPNSEKINEYMENSLELEGQGLKAHFLRREPERDTINVNNQDILGFSSFSKDYGKTESSELNFNSNALSHIKAKETLAKNEENQDEKRFGDDDSIEKHLDQAANKVDIRTFLTLRSILKPHRVVLLCCEGLLRVMAGLEDIPSNYAFKNFEWNEIKTLFTNPIKFVSLVSSFKSFVQNGKISAQKIEDIELTLSKIEVHLDAPDLEAFTQLNSFLSIAAKYYRYCENNNTIQKIIEEEPERTVPTPIKCEKSSVKRQLINMCQQNHQAQLVKKIPQDGQGLSSKQTLKKAHERNASFSRADSSFSREKPDLRVKARSVSKSPVKTVQPKPVQSTAKKANSSNKGKEIVKREEELYYESNFMEDAEIELSEAGELKDDIEVGERDLREYRSKVKRMLADHDRFVKKQIKEHEDLEEERNREHALEEWRKTHEQLQQLAENEKDWRHNRNMEKIKDLKETNEQKLKEEKENQNEELIESLQDHYYNSFKTQQKKENNQKELQERCKNVLTDKIDKKQKEALDSISQKTELAKIRRDHFASRKIDVEIEKNKWQKDYLMLAKLIGDAK